MIDSAPSQLPVLPGMPAQTAAGSTAGAADAEGVATDGAAPPVFAQLLAALRVDVDTDGTELLDAGVTEGEGEGEGEGRTTSGDVVPAIPILTAQIEGGVLISPLEPGGVVEAEHGLTLDLGAGVVDAPRVDGGEPVVMPGGAIEVVPAGQLAGQPTRADLADVVATTVDRGDTATVGQQLPAHGVDGAEGSAEEVPVTLVQSSARDELERAQTDADADADADGSEFADNGTEQSNGVAEPADALLDDEGSTGRRADDLDVDGLDDAAAEQRPGESSELGADADVDVAAGRIETARGTAGTDAAPATVTSDRAAAATATPAAPIAVEQVAAESNESAPLVIDRVALRNVPTVVVDRVRALDPSGGTNRAVVRLDPPDLGQIVVEVVGRGDEIAVVARADTAEAARALVRQRAEIQAAVEALGLSVSDFDVHHGDGNDGQGQQGRDQRPNRPAVDGGPAGYQTAELPEPEGELFL